jgi:outer membrane protein assembly factor BamB
VNRWEEFMINKKVAFPVLMISMLTLVLVSCGTKEAEFNWPRWRGPEGNGISRETDWNPEALAGGPKILWKSNVGMGYSNVVIMDNRLYTIGVTKDGNTVVCLNADTGQEIWRSPIVSSRESQSTATIDGDYLYALTIEGILICLKARNGKLRWRKDLVAEYDLTIPTYGFAASPVVEGDLIVLTANNYGMALDKRTGELIWKSEKPPEKIRGGTHYSTPVMYDYDGKRYSLISCYDGLHSVEVTTGKVLWTYPWETSQDTHATEPIVFDNKVFITRYARAGSVLLDIGDGMPKVLWKNDSLGSDIASPVLVEAYIYGVDGGPEVKQCSLRCLDVESGEVVWEQVFGKIFKNVNLSLMTANGKLIVLEDTGKLHIAEAFPSLYQEISSCDVLEGERTKRWFWTHPVLCNGKIYCRNYPGELVCIDVSK